MPVLKSRERCDASRLGTTRVDSADPDRLREWIAYDPSRSVFTDRRRTIAANWQAGDLLGLKFLDRVVIGNGRHVSFSDGGIF